MVDVPVDVTDARIGVTMGVILGGAIISATTIGVMTDSVMMDVTIGAIISATMNVMVGVTIAIINTVDDGRNVFLFDIKGFNGDIIIHGYRARMR